MEKSLTPINNTEIDIIALKSILKVLIATLSKDQSEQVSKMLTSICDTMEANATGQVKGGLMAVRASIFEVVSDPLANDVVKN
jgi:hypothetical protein